MLDILLIIQSHHTTVFLWFKTSLLFSHCIASPTKKKQKKEGENKWKRRRLLFNSQIVYYLMNIAYLHNSIKKAWDTTKIEDMDFWVRFRSVMQSCANNIYKKLLKDYIRILFESCYDDSSHLILFSKLKLSY